ncbi:amidase [Limimaricola pyoseonensis]|uniref:Aspartyl-tRNA(Asn)/glutamyl-tRNA(Gln) amidotransferase subunit A n=1 Tax=Limimaricola pyoseonensis TaxID=521013 RepID=A0A1G7E6D3_9RHOB|nr:amidase family protein [Limimaricola pyoseonensis]SDE59278.1 aspartyl-tRNA(Asn)/glutamyl-tRNA(Gln) amidotransferase subunit A [Limimaricola pyoseonensis]
MTDWRRMTAAALGQGIGAGEIDPVELTEHFLDAIDAHPDGARIYARTTPDRALAEAASARERARLGLRRGPLDGVPVSWKDLFDSAGVETGAGTRLMAGRVPGSDAEILRRATAAGLVCLGKTHMTEIAFSGLGLNPRTATPPNIFDPETAPGGSSSGAAASVAHGLAPVAIGSDTGGSIRVPSVWNGLVGLKPTHGALPMQGAVPLCTSFDTAGPLARTVADGVLALEALGGPAADLRGASLSGARLLVIDTVVTEDFDPAVSRGFDAALSRLDGEGAEIVRRAHPPLEEAYALSGPLYTAEAWAWWRERIEAAPDTLYPPILDRVRAGRDVSAADWIAGWDRLRALRAGFRAATASFDAVICPGVAIRPPKVQPLLDDSEAFRLTNLKTLRNTRLANLMGLCSAALPAGDPGCGVLLNGPAGADRRLWRLAAAVEAALA